MCASIVLVVAEGHFGVPTADKALNVVVDVEERIPKFFLDWCSPVADLNLAASVVFVLEEIAGVVIRSGYGSEEGVLHVLLVDVKAFTLLAEISLSCKDDLLVHESSQFVCLVLLKLCHDVK